ncbi:MAG: Tad domain-containing protein [Burkholderiaceae bacterium]|nr:Tad domain-containing protein [Burkholderiaceae bacterium]
MALGARARQRGQALVFIAATAVIVLLVTLATFNVGQLSYHRMKLQNTADATVYTAAVSQARALNFSAYMNRGVIANQVQVAQIVSLTGWIRALDDVHNGPLAEIGTIFANMSPLSAMWTVPSEVIGPIVGGIKDGVDSGAPVAVMALDLLIDALNGASLIYHGGYIVNLVDSIPEVIEANEPKQNGQATAQISAFGTTAMAISAVRAAAFVTLPSPVDPRANPKKDGDNRMVNVVQASTDLFYKNRVLVPIWPVPFLIDPTRFVNPGFGPVFMMRFHSGGGSLRASSSGNTHAKGWTSLDASGYLIIVSLTLNILGIPIPIVFPLPPLPAGAGAAAAGDSSHVSQSGLSPFGAVQHRNDTNSGPEPSAMVQFGGAHVNPMTLMSAWIQTGIGPGDNMDSNAGLKPYMEVKANIGGPTSNQAVVNGQQHLNDIAPPWILEVRRRNNTLITSTTGGYRIGGSADGQLALPASLADDEMRAMSSAEAYFARPNDVDYLKRPDGKIEWGSLYSPYWQARLRANSLLEQGVSMMGTYGEGEGWFPW